MLSTELTLPLRLLRSGGVRHLLTVIALATGVALVSAFDVANPNVLAAFREVLDTTGGRAALQVTSIGGASFPRRIAYAVSAVPGVALASPVVSGTAFLTDRGGEPLTVQGVDLLDRHVVAVYEPDDDDTSTARSRALAMQTILMTRSLAARRGIAAGDVIAVQARNGIERLRVGDLVEPTGVGSVYGDRLVVTNVETASRLFTSPGFVNRVDVVIAPGAERDAVARAIAAALPPGFRLEAPAQRQADLERAIRSLQPLLQSVRPLTAFLAFLVAYNSLATVFAGRAWQLGLLQAIGVKPRGVVRLLVVEGSVIGVAGVAIGLPVGIALGYALIPWIRAACGLSVMRLAAATPFTVEPTSLLLGAGLGIAGAAVASLLAGRRAVAMGVAAVLRTRHAAPPDSARHWPWLGCALGIAAFAVAAATQSATRNVGWGIVATALAPLVVLSAAHPICQGVSRLFVDWTGRRPRNAHRMAASALSRARQRTALTVTVVAVGIGSVLWLRTVEWSFERSVVDSLASVAGGDLVISSPYSADGVQTAPISADVTTAVRNVAGVAGVIGNRVAEWHFRDGPIAMDSYDREYFETLAPRYLRSVGEIRDDDWRRVASGEAALVSANFAYNLGVEAGDSLTLETPTGPLTLPVVGVVSLLWSPRGTVVMQRGLYERRWSDDGVNRLYARLEETASPAEVGAAITSAVGGSYALQIASGDALVDYLAGRVRQAFAALDPVALLMLFIVLAAVAETLTASVVDRAWEFGVLRAIGARRRVLRSSVLFEALFIAAIGIALAVAMGAALGVFWVSTTFTHLLGWVLEWHPPWAWGSAMVGLTLVACLLAAWLSMRRMAGIEPASALRQE